MKRIMRLLLIISIITLMSAMLTFAASAEAVADESGLRAAIDAAAEGEETVIPLGTSVEITSNIEINGGKSITLSGGDIAISGNIQFILSGDSSKLKLDGVNVVRSAAAAPLFALNDASELTLSGETIIDGNNEGNGVQGALAHLKGASALIIDGATVQNFKGGVLAGAVYAEGTSSVTMKSGEIKNITGKNFGGAITINGGTFSMEGGSITGCTSTDSGGAIFLWNGSGEMTDGEISGNSTAKGGGVCVGYGTNAAEFTMSGGSIKNNTASGGGVYVYNSNCSFTLCGGIISDNEANNNGGGVFNAGEFVLQSGKVTGNTSATHAAGVYNAGTIIIEGGEISANAATQHGGGIYNAGSMEMSAGSITENISTIHGAGIYNDAAGTVTATGGSITENAATGGGGGIYNYNVLSMENTVISGNTAKGDGAGIHNRKTVTIKNSEIKGNIASNNAGGVFNNTGCSFTMESGKIADNRATQHAGGMFNAGTFVMTDGEITGNEAGYDNASARYGGGLYNSGSFTMNGGSIENNKADWGGGIYSESSLTIDGGEISGNAAQFGGGIFIPDKDITFAMSAGVVSGNTASNNGGGIFSWSKTLNMTGGEVSGNTAKTNGGGMYIEGGGDTATLSGSVKITENNVTSGVGGGIYLKAAVLKVAGGARVADNTVGDSAKNNVYLYAPNLLTLSGELTEEIGISIEGGGAGTVFGTADTAATVSGAENFILDGAGTVVGSVSAGKLVFTETAAEGPEAMIGDKSYDTLIEALNEAKDNDIIVVKKNIVPVAALTIGEKVTITGDTESVTVTLTNPVTVTGALTLENITFKKNTSTPPENLISVASGGSLTLNDKAVLDGASVATTANGGGITVATGGKLTLNTGSVIKNCKGNLGGAIYLSADSALTMKGGEITGNTATGNGGGIYSAGSIEITAGRIEGNSGSWGGGIYSESSLTIDGGEVSGNTALFGGGIFIPDKDITFTMSAGVVSENTASNNGGGIFSWSKTLNMTGGEVSGNTAKTNGGGMYIEGGGDTATLSGSVKISGNKTENGDGAGIYLKGAELKVSGKISINSNIKSETTENNLYLSTANLLTLSGNLTDTIGISIADGAAGTEFGTVDTAATVSGAEKFVLDGKGSLVGSVSEGKLVFVKKQITDPEATIGNTDYGTLIEALNEAEDNDVIVVKKNIAPAVALTIGEKVTITGDTESITVTLTNPVTVTGALTLENITFKKNTSTPPENLISVASGGSLTLNDKAVLDGASVATTANGGGITVAAGGKLTLNTGSVIKNCKGHLGGAVFLSADSVLTMTGGEISGNEATAHGGGVFNAGSINMSGGSIKGNKSTVHGAGIYNDAAGTVTATGGSITENAATGGGGGIYNYNVLSMENTVISGNTAKGDGAGIHNRKTVTIKNSEIKGNIASNNAGGVFNNTGCSFTMESGKIADNRATQHAGGMFNAGTFVMTDGEITGNEAGYDNASARYGGGLYNSGSFTMNGGSIENNKADWGGGIYSENSLTIDGGEISGNAAQFGGGIFVKNATLKVTGGIITANEATAHGGGIYNQGSIQMSGGSIKGNKSTVHGAGIYNDAAGTVTATGGSITENAATGGGGGIYNYNVLSMENTVISGNTAKGDGAGIHNRKTVTIKNSEIKGNIASNNAGGVFNNTGCSFTMENGIIADNKAIQHAGGMFNAGTMVMTGGEITGNEAGYDNASARYGGGLYNSGIISIRGGKIKENTGDMGCGIFIDTNATVKISGDAYVIDNAVSGSTVSQNAYINAKADGSAYGKLILDGELTGLVGVTKQDAAEGIAFGSVEGDAAGASRLFSDTANLVGAISENLLVWGKALATEGNVGVVVDVNNYRDTDIAFIGSETASVVMVTVDGVALEEENYKANGLTITINKDYLEEIMGEGEYIVSVWFDDGSAGIATLKIYDIHHSSMNRTLFNRHTEVSFSIYAPEGEKVTGIYDRNGELLPSDMVVYAYNIDEYLSGEAEKLAAENKTVKCYEMVYSGKQLQFTLCQYYLMQYVIDEGEYSFTVNFSDGSKDTVYLDVYYDWHNLSNMSVVAADELPIRNSWKAASSSERNDSKVAKAFDGDKVSHWHTYYEALGAIVTYSAGNTNPQNVVLDFGERINIGGVRYYFRYNSADSKTWSKASIPNEIDVLVSDDNIKWEKAGSISVNSAKATNELAFTVNKRCRYVKLIFKNIGNILSFSAGEIRLLSPKAANEPKAAELSCYSLVFDPAVPEDITLNYKLNEAVEITKFTVDGNDVKEGYISYNDDSITINRYFFEDLGYEEGDSINFNIQFLKGADAAFTVNVGAIKYDVTYSVSGNGTVKAESETGEFISGEAVSAGNKVTFTAMPEAGYEVESVAVRGKNTTYIQDRKNWVWEASSEFGGGKVSALYDDNPDTFWHSWYTAVGTAVTAYDKAPYEFTIYFDKVNSVAGLSLLPRKNAANGKVIGYEILGTIDGRKYESLIEGEIIYEGNDDYGEKSILLPKTAELKGIKLVIKSTSGDYGYLAELNVLTEIELTISRETSGTLSERWVIPELFADAEVSVSFKEMATGNADVKYDISNIKVTGDDKASLGETYEIVLTAEEGYKLPDTVTVKKGDFVLLEGTDYTYDKVSGILKVNNVNGDIDIIAYAVDTVPHYTITYKDDYGAKGELPKAAEIRQGDTIKVEKTNLTLSGYTFVGWSYGGETYKAGDSFIPTEDVEFTTLWEAKKDKDSGSSQGGNKGSNSGSGGGFTITGGSSKKFKVTIVGVEEYYLESGKTVEFLPDKEGLHFTGYYLDEALTVPYSNVPLIEAVTLYPAWEKARERSELKDMISHWAYDTVGAMYEAYLVNGKSEGIFAPEDDITRAEFVTILYNMSKETVTGEISFSDVSASDWYYDAVRWAVISGVTVGTDENSFSPGEKITREQMVTMIYRYAEKRGKASAMEGELSFADKDDVASYAKNAVLWAKESGIIQGYPDGTFMPKGNITRAEAATMIYRFSSGK